MTWLIAFLCLIAVVVVGAFFVISLVAAAGILVIYLFVVIASAIAGYWLGESVFHDSAISYVCAALAAVGGGVLLPWLLGDQKSTSSVTGKSDEWAHPSVAGLKEMFDRFKSLGAAVDMASLQALRIEVVRLRESLHAMVDGARGIKRVLDEELGETTFHESIEQYHDRASINSEAIALHVASIDKCYGQLFYAKAIGDTTSADHPIVGELPPSVTKYLKTAAELHTTFDELRNRSLEIERQKPTLMEKMTGALSGKESYADRLALLKKDADLAYAPARVVESELPAQVISALREHAKSLVPVKRTWRMRLGLGA